MDEEIADEVTSVDAIDRTHLQRKDCEHPLPGSSNMTTSHEMVIPSERGNHDRVGASEHACPSPHYMDDARGIVEELTLRTFNSENLAIVGISENKERAQTRQNQCQNLYQIAGGSGSGSSPGGTGHKDNHCVMSTVWEDVGYTIFPEFLAQRIPKDDNNEAAEPIVGNEDKAGSSNSLFPSGSIRTKILSKSGLSEYFVKNTLKGKGVIQKSPAHERSSESARTHSTSVGVARDSDARSDRSGETVVPSSCGIVKSFPGVSSDSFNGGVSMREWLKAGLNKASKVESLYIFRQIVDLVDVSHIRGVTLQDLRPSFFKLLSSKQIIYLGSFAPKEILDTNAHQDKHCVSNDQEEKRPLEQDILPHARQSLKKQKYGENIEFMKQRPQFPSRSGFRSVFANDKKYNFTGPQDTVNEISRVHTSEIGYVTHRRSSTHLASNAFRRPLISVNDPLEEKWYNSPEDVSECGSTGSSNIYALGVLLFELLSSFESERAHTVAMLDLRHRILPPELLSENPKEAGFCLWLLHPEPSSRPRTREILQSEIIDGTQVLGGDEFSSSINQEDAESELLLHFLLSLKERKQKDASKLVEEIRCVEADIEEVVKRQTKGSSSCLAKEIPREHSVLELFSRVSPVSNNELGLTRNVRQLESAYLSTRSVIQGSDNVATGRTDRDLLKHKESWYQAHNDTSQEPSDRLGIFFNGLCKYARYSKFEVRGILRNGDFNNSANVICCLSFNRDEEYFAAAGVSKKIKIYEFPALFDDSVDIYYPVFELSNKSKLSCVCWNSYIRNYLASTDYEGIVKLWDVETGQEFSKYVEHDKRAWSVDFSQSDPTRLASGSDDCSVKLWSINEKNSLCTIRNIANVCSVQFSADSTHLLSFGSADYKTYCYDLRNVSMPWCILTGHDKAVSHVKFLDSETIVSASTDNTLKIWDLSKTSSYGLSTNACILTLRGHTNDKNFVGLSVADGYIACGSEINEVYAYFRSLPMPITSHKFGTIDPITGKETDDDNGQFVSSVCWRQKSDMVVAANSTGCIKLLQMV